MSEKKHSSLDKLGIWIIGATVLGAVTGLVLRKDAQMLAPMGNLFMQLIKSSVPQNGEANTTVARTAVVKSAASINIFLDIFRHPFLAYSFTVRYAVLTFRRAIYAQPWGIWLSMLKNSYTIAAMTTAIPVSMTAIMINAVWSRLS